ncbi:MAG: hypothetical protein KF795_19570 [Labilithrix sp.]|nr:hypothetical protein [Labilithrix sp.]
MVAIAAACSSSDDDANGTDAGNNDAGTGSDTGPSNDDAGTDASEPPADGGDAGSDANDGGGRSGLPQDKQVVDLDENERRQLCDWTASIQGGYGVIRQCDGGPVPSAPNQQACVDGVPEADCELTVAEYETCAARFASDACTAFGSAECAPVVMCMPR